MSLYTTNSSRRIQRALLLMKKKTCRFQSVLSFSPIGHSVCEVDTRLTLKIMNGFDTEKQNCYVYSQKGSEILSLCEGTFQVFRVALLGLE